MNWTPLQTTEQVEEIIVRSQTTPQVIFKHSTRCSISSVAKSRLEKAEAPEGIDFHYLDLISYRSVSNTIAERFGIYHESPQILLIKDGRCIYNESHTAIDMEELRGQLN